MLLSDNWWNYDEWNLRVISVWLACEPRPIGVLRSLCLCSPDRWARLCSYRKKIIISNWYMSMILGILNLLSVCYDLWYVRMPLCVGYLYLICTNDYPVKICSNYDACLMNVYLYCVSMIRCYSPEFAAHTLAIFFKKAVEKPFTGLSGLPTF